MEEESWSGVFDEGERLEARQGPPFGPPPGFSTTATSTSSSSSSSSPSSSQSSAATSKDSTETSAGSSATESANASSSSHNVATASTLGTSITRSTPTRTTHLTGLTTSPTGAAASSTNSPNPTSSQTHHGGISSGVLAAAVVIPLLVGLVLVIFAFIFLRRRRRSNRSNADAAALVPSLSEKANQDPRGGAMHGLNSHPVGAMTVLPFGQEHDRRSSDTESDAWAAGAYDGDASTFRTESRSRADDTDSWSASSSIPSNNIFSDVPPIYTAAGRAQRLPRANAGTLVHTTGGPTERTSSPLNHNGLIDPSSSSSGGGTGSSRGSDSIQESLNDDAADSLAVPAARPTSSAARTDPNSSARSITSTLYSDSASVHSARAARMSVGPMEVMSQGFERGMSGGPEWSPQDSNLASVRPGGTMSPHGSFSSAGSDPFHDPHSPVSSIADEDASVLRGRRSHR